MKRWMLLLLLCCGAGKLSAQVAMEDYPNYYDEYQRTSMLVKLLGENVLFPLLDKPHPPKKIPYVPYAEVSNRAIPYDESKYLAYMQEVAPHGVSSAIASLRPYTLSAQEFRGVSAPAALFPHPTAGAWQLTPYRSFPKFPTLQWK